MADWAIVVDTGIHMNQRTGPTPEVLDDKGFHRFGFVMSRFQRAVPRQHEMHVDVRMITRFPGSQLVDIDPVVAPIPDEQF
jgi:hypothetical protein